MARTQVIKPEWRGKGGSAPVARALRDLGRTLGDVRGQDGVEVQIRHGRMTFSGGGDWLGVLRYACLGISRISGATVYLNGGEVQWGVQAPIELADAEVEITADYQYLGVAFNGTALTLLAPSTDKAAFRSDASVWRTWLYQFRLINARARLYRIGRLAGNIEIPAWFGA
jgi:hypothetical protein